MISEGPLSPQLLFSPSPLPLLQFSIFNRQSPIPLAPQAGDQPRLRRDKQHDKDTDVQGDERPQLFVLHSDPRNKQHDEDTDAQGDERPQPLAGVVKGLGQQVHGGHVDEGTGGYGGGDGDVDLAEGVNQRQ